MTNQNQDISKTETQVIALRKDVDRILIFLYGDEDMGIKGMSQRIKELENVAKRVDKFQWILYGIAIGLGLTSIGSIGTFIMALSKAAGGP